MRVVICGDVSLQNSNEYFVRGETETLFHDVPTVFEDVDGLVVGISINL